MESVLYLKSVIQEVATIESSRTFDTKTPEAYEWKLIKGAVKILEPLKITSNMWEVEKSASINTVIERLHFHHYSLLQFVNYKSNCDYGVSFARYLRRILNERFPNCGSDFAVNRLGNFLDPSKKGINLKALKKYALVKADCYDLAENIGLKNDHKPKDKSLELDKWTKYLYKKAGANEINSEEMGDSELCKEISRYEDEPTCNNSTDILKW